MTFARFTAATAVAVGLLAVSSASVSRGASIACSAGATILQSPRAGSWEVQAKGLNDRGDIVGFADGGRGTRVHAILWMDGTVAGAVDLGLLPGYVASEAYGVNDRRVVFGLLYDKKERVVPFRWANGRMTVLKGPNGQPVYTENPRSSGRNAINSRGEMAWTVIVQGKRRAIRWAPDGKAAFLPALPGHTWTDAFTINDDGVVSGWSSRISNKVGEENPVLWTRSGKVVPLKTAPGQSDGIAEATNSSGLTVGYLGNLGTDTDPEHDQFAVWRTRMSKPRLMGRLRPNLITEFVDVNDRGQAAGMTGMLNAKTGFVVAAPVIWRVGWPNVRALAVPAASRRASPVLVPQLNDINDRGAIVGNVYGATRENYGSIRRIDPVVWTCQFGG
jgi:probable HAF family extracellular repeat protein